MLAPQQPPNREIAMPSAEPLLAIQIIRLSARNFPLYSELVAVKSINDWCFAVENIAGYEVHACCHLLARNASVAHEGGDAVKVRDCVFLFAPP